MAKKISSWAEVIKQVLTEKGAAMHYHEIADEIVAKQLRPADKIGATPAITVNSYLHGDSLKDEVVNMGKGCYILKSIYDADPASATTQNIATDAESDSEEDLSDALITAYGRYWDRSLWEANDKRVVGKNMQVKKAPAADFTDASAIYLLHLGYEVIYVGQAKNLVQRLDAHTADDKRNRWDRFSWFSVSEIAGDEDATQKTIDIGSLLDTLEALLIETLGPSRNKKVGNDFEDKEFEQIPLVDYYQSQGK